MHAKTMEGLAGASMSMKMMNTPLHAYKEAERKGDTATMERAMGYVGDLAGQAEDYQKKTEKGMKEDGKEARESEKLQQQQAIQKRKEEREEQEKRIAESRKENKDTVSISENGKAVLEEKLNADHGSTDGSMSVEQTEQGMKPESVIYTKTGEATDIKPESGENLSVSV